jgi:hypothetical protein
MSGRDGRDDGSGRDGEDRDDRDAGTNEQGEREDPFEQLPDEGTNEDGDGGPFDELGVDPDAELGERTPASDVPEDPFEEMDVEMGVGTEADADWERLLDPEEAVETPERGQNGEGIENEATVQKSLYCEDCEHFSDPPETACTYPGGEITAVVDMEHFRVRNCPVVERRRREEAELLPAVEGRTAGDESED